MMYHFLDNKRGSIPLLLIVVAVLFTSTRNLLLPSLLASLLILRASDELTVVSSADAVNEVLQGLSSCDYVGEQFIDNNTTNTTNFNKLRRNVALSQPECFEEHFDRFAEALFARKGLKQLNLHIPKTGGTSLCELAHRNHNYSYSAYPSSACWPNSMPSWWYFGLTGHHLTCQALQHLTSRSSAGGGTSGWDYVANERWLDHPMCLSHHAYSITLREPVSRAMSHIQHTKRDEAVSGNTMKERWPIMKSNYITWSLVSGRSNLPAPQYVTTMMDLQPAKDILSSFDYILALDSQSQCDEVIYRMMGMKDTKIGHAMKAPSSSYNSNYNETEYEALNQVDIRLYEYAQELRRVDCDFFLRLKDRIMATVHG